MHVDAREKLAAAQLEVVRALTGQTGAPAEFDRARIEATICALSLKRARSVAHAWPRLARALGDSFDGLFSVYAQAAPIADKGGAIGDGRRFARELHRAGKLPDEGLIEAMAFDIRFRAGRDQITPRKIAFRAARLKESRRIVIAIRLPLLGEMWLNASLKII